MNVVASSSTSRTSLGLLALILMIVSSLVTIYFVKSWQFLKDDFWWMLLAGLIGLFVGLSELLNRYKAFRYIFANGYSWMYMIINLLAGILAFIFFRKYNIRLGTIGNSGLGLSFAAGLGAMAFLRSSFFSYKDSNDKPVEIGPAALLTIFLRASERQFDQIVALKTLKEIGAIMSGLNFISASKDLPIIILKSMLVLSSDEQKKLSEDIGNLLNDESSNNEIRNVTLGIIVSRYSGSLLLKEAVAALKKIYEENKPNIELTDLS